MPLSCWAISRVIRPSSSAPIAYPTVWTHIEPVGAADALSQLAAHTFHLDEPGTLATLARLVGDVPTYTLTSGDLDEAVDAVLNVIGEAKVT